MRLVGRLEKKAGNFLVFLGVLAFLGRCAVEAKSPAFGAGLCRSAFRLLRDHLLLS